MIKIIRLLIFMKYSINFDWNFMKYSINFDWNSINSKNIRINCIFI